MTYSLGKRKTLIHIKKKANQRLCYCLTFCTCGINYISFLIYFSIEERHKKDLLLHSLHRYGLGNGMTLLAVNKPDQKLLSNYSGLSFFFLKSHIPTYRGHAPILTLHFCPQGSQETHPARWCRKHNFTFSSVVTG